MIMRTRNSQQGSAMIEFCLVGVPVLVLMLATMQLCLSMWQYHTLAYSVHEATRFVSVHGRGCVTGVTSCAITVSDIATRLKNDSIGMDPNAMSVTLTTNSGAVTTCSPLASCIGNPTRWPPSSNLDNTTGKRVIVSATHTSNRTLMLLGAYTIGPVFNLPATSTGTIAF